jgi:hypothetical protein
LRWQYWSQHLPSLFGQAPRNNKGRKSEDDEARRQVLFTDDRRTDALRRNDGALLHQIYADDYTLVTPSTGAIRSKAEQINDLLSGHTTHFWLNAMPTEKQLWTSAGILK